MTEPVNYGSRFVTLPCEACRQGVQVSLNLLAQAEEKGIPLNIRHEVCPRDRSNLPMYTVVFELLRTPSDGQDGHLDDEVVLLAKQTRHVVGPGLDEDVIALLDKHVTASWAMVKQSASMMEEGLDEVQHQEVPDDKEVPHG